MSHAGQDDGPARDLPVSEAADPGPAREDTGRPLVWLDAEEELRWDRYLVPATGREDDAWISVDEDRIDVVDVEGYR